MRATRLKETARARGIGEHAAPRAVVHSLVEISIEFATMAAVD